MQLCLPLSFPRPFLPVVLSSVTHFLSTFQHVSIFYTLTGLCLWSRVHWGSGTEGKRNGGEFEDSAVNILFISWEMFLFCCTVASYLWGTVHKGCGVCVCVCTPGAITHVTSTTWCYSPSGKCLVYPRRRFCIEALWLKQIFKTLSFIRMFIYSTFCIYNLKHNSYWLVLFEGWC